MAKTMQNKGNPLSDKLAATTDKVQASQAWNSIFRPGSIFRKGYTDSPRNRSYVIMNSVLYHLHPVKVKRHAVKVSYTLCLGGLSFFLFIVLTVTGIFLMFFYRPTATQAWSDIANLHTGVTFGLLAGVIAALKRGSVFDHGVMTISLAGYSMPIFWWGLILIMLFSVTLGWTPVSGRLDLLYDIEPKTGFMLIDTLLSDEEGAFLDALHHLILPAIVLGTIPLAVIARMTRSAMLEVLREDYVRTARAKGLSPARVVFVHALRNAMIPVLTVFGLQVGALLAGAVLTETIFSWPGIGKWLIDAISRRDYPVVQNGILLVATLVILVNFTVDILYGLVNPRIRHQR